MDAVPDQLLTASEVAERVRVTTATVRRWAAEGRVPSIALDGSRRRFSWPAVLHALQRGEPEHVSAPLGRVLADISAPQGDKGTA